MVDFLVLYQKGRNWLLLKHEVSTEHIYIIASAKVSCQYSFINYYIHVLFELITLLSFGIFSYFLIFTIMFI